MTSVLREMGLGRPCSLRNRPQALHSTEPNSSRRHSGVVDVVQFWHVGCEDVLVAIMMPVLSVQVKSVGRRRERNAINIIVIDKDDGAKKTLAAAMRWD